MNNNTTYYMANRFTKDVMNDIKVKGLEIEGLYMESCGIKLLSEDIFDFLPKLKWLDLR